MPGRQFNGNDYKYGFNGKLKDDEINVNGGSYDFGARIFDSRLGRFLSVDNDFAKGPAYSPYNYSLNSPLYFNDPDGNWVGLTTTKYYMKDGEMIPKTTFRDIFRRTVKIKKEFVIHDAKLYFADPILANKSDEWKASYAKNFQASIVKGNSGSERKYEKEGKVYGADKTIEVTVSFAEDIKVIDNSQEIDNNDNLYVIAGSNFKAFGKRLAESSEAHTTKGSNVAIFENPDGGTASHESLHQLGLEHVSMPADLQNIEYNGLKHMGDSYNKNDDIVPTKNILKKLEKSKKP